VIDTATNPDPVEITYMIAATVNGKWQIDDVHCFTADGAAC